ncbi:TetR/AcrR family transcriptional regulator [Paenibacillus physcomitrellae]|uniref:TetR family transcriptional regulator n=1 Tax=Paenibacillus physcomitrellae TaxID=1619311 RepID=A0ABQ1FPV5_9BACL|nr:TetR/AcrR family transcriptional regulator [Paenibacillus physcomitrellae]GGA24495.1 TetR family transcriptional regulator [Paenibacillus physcomitrellae]
MDKRPGKGVNTSIGTGTETGTGTGNRPTGAGVKTDLRIIKTKTAINRAFLELFAEKELEQITINEIAAKANVNRGTVYLHYSDKFDLLDKSIEDHLEQLITFCNHDQEPGGQISLISELEPVFIYLQQNYLFFSAMLANERSSLFRERLLHFISSNIKTKLDNHKAPSGIDPELNAQFMAASFVGIVEWWIKEKMPHPPGFMAEQLWKLLKKNEVI